MPLSTESSLSMAVLHCEQQRWGAEPFLLSVQWCLSWRMPRTDTAAGAVLLSCTCGAPETLSEEVPCCAGHCSGGCGRAQGHGGELTCRLYPLGDF